ncbi:GNAT family N-acetyltransferase [Halorussus sp. MSC15.2]|uniref:GNAT family N-acetyltransferase n=1 Tax=Halorussus sp. MSC15.2 TaxID=2283638 RepID=UPI0013D544EF|nr:GNAT family N-acetyltransferase [Halorussus sp. MSC15.2]NEU58348.1 GNAT family N-acetyltransferase [Halorussus sp. MSC15.2]
MTRDDREYPDGEADSFREPPVSFTDKEDREIEIRPYEDGDFEALVEMYTDFDPADRAQGIPPATESQVRDWFENLLEGLNVVAWHDDRAVGHATLVPDEESYELAIFVHQEYQRAGTGSRLIRALLGHGQANGVEQVWLTVERWNHAAVNLYESVGFETHGTESFELEMVLRL